MKAAVHTRYGPPEVVRIAEVDTPSVGDHEVLVKVHATTVNRTDCGFRAAKPFIVRVFSGLIRPKATVLGSEFAGVVEAIGGGVTSFEVGDQVFGFSERPVRCSRRVHVDPRRRSTRDHAGERDLRGGRAQHRGFALRPLVHHEGEDPERAGRARQRRDRSDRLGGGPDPEESRRRRDRGLRHRSTWSW